MEISDNSHNKIEEVLAIIFSALVLIMAADWFIRGRMSLVSGILFIMIICLSFLPLRRFIKQKMPALIPRKDISILLVIIFLGLTVFFSI